MHGFRGRPPRSTVGDRSMFSADVFPAEHAFPPKNGPVSSQPASDRHPLAIISTRPATSKSAAANFAPFQQHPDQAFQTGSIPGIEPSRHGAVQIEHADQAAR